MNNELSRQPFLSVVIPVYCEGAFLQEVLAKIQNAVEGINEPYELILVDDGSTDNTWEVVRKVSKTYKMLKSVRLSRNFGKEAALSAGLDRAQGKIVITMDGDLQHPPSLIPEMVRIWRESEPDIVEAIKTDRGNESVIGRLGATFFYYIMNKLSGYNIRGASDFKLMNRHVVDAWRSMNERNLFFRGMSAWLGFKRIQIPFEVPERIGGSSRWSFLRLLRLSLGGVTAFSSLPLHFISLMGGLILCISIILGIQTLYFKFSGRAVSGFATVILLLLLIGSVIMIGLGIIGEYIARIYEEVKGRPRYVVAEEIGESNN